MKTLTHLTNRSEKDGFALVVTMLVVLVVSALTTGAILVGGNQTLANRYYERTNQLQILASSGLERLLGPKKWSYYYLYVIMDIYSRYVVGWMVADRENSALAGRLIQQSCLKHGVHRRMGSLAPSSTATRPSIQTAPTLLSRTAWRSMTAMATRSPASSGGSLWVLPA